MPLINGMSLEETPPNQSRSDNVNLHFFPAHYLHSSGNFNVYDEEAKILMFGYIGAALESSNAPMFVDNFNEHIPKMKMFH